jgi:hypothetical protein
MPIALPPDVKRALSNLDEVRADITAIKGLLARLVELEEAKQHRHHMHVNLRQ